MLDWYIGECRVLLIDINNGIKEAIRGYHNWNSSQTWMFGGCVKVSESLYIQDASWVNSVLNHIHTGVSLPRYEGSCMTYRLEWY